MRALLEEIRITPAGTVVTPEGEVPAALGRGGRRADKREGDGATPTGRFALRYCLYRPDRVARPITALATRPIGPADGWCDDPAVPDRYNRPVPLPFAGSHEVLWREDRLYDVIVVVGHNDDPPVPGAGSAIFLHMARPDFSATEGCVALARPTLLGLLPLMSCATHLVIEPPDS